jgi:predicted LPLAT superfamily acyltransferase
MRSAGVYDETVFRSYFEQVALHLCNAVRLFRAARSPGAAVDLARRQVEVDASIAQVRKALEGGRGALLVPPHVCNYLLTLARLNQEVPVWVYLRWSSDTRKRQVKQAWCQAAGLPVILEPMNAADPASRAAACVEVLHRGAALVMTPDIPQKDGKGVPVELLGRRVFLPTGPASIAMLADAPLVPIFGRLVESAHLIYAHPPIAVRSLSRSEGGRKAGLQQAMQRWTSHFEAFLRDCPQAWFLWGDNRWTRAFQGDARYSAPLPPTNAPDECCMTHETPP